MILQWLPALVIVPLTAVLAETGRINWMFGLSSIFLVLMATVLFPRLKTIKVTGAEIELFERRAREVSDAEIKRIQSEVEIQRESLLKIASEAKYTRKSLEMTQSQIRNTRESHTGS